MRRMSREERAIALQYRSLIKVLAAAYKRAAQGKGRERHATNNSFDEQDICSELRVFGISPALFQARKKIKESLRLDTPMAVNELLDAIVYLSAAVIVLEEEKNEN